VTPDESGSSRAHRVADDAHGTTPAPQRTARGFDPAARYGRRGAERLRRVERSEDRTAHDPDAPSVGWRFVIGRRWATYFAVAIGFAVLCAFFGMWQWDRRNEAVRENAQIAANYDHTPVEVTTALPTARSFSDDQTWLRVRVTGRYDVAEQLLVRNRVHNGQPGFEVLTPLVTDSGRAFIVDRGWVPTGNRQDAPDHVPAPPTGTVQVVARLQASEPHIPGRSDPAHGDEVQSVTLPDVADRVSHPIWAGAYGQLDTEDPAPTQQAPLGWDRPSADTGLHLSYFIQWFMFAVGGFGFLGYLMVQEYRNLNQDDPEERERALERQRRREARPQTDDEIEDALLDERGATRAR